MRFVFQCTGFDGRPAVGQQPNTLKGLTMSNQFKDRNPLVVGGTSGMRLNGP